MSASGIYTLTEETKALQHGSLLHPKSSRGVITLAQKGSNGAWKEQRVKPSDLSNALESLQGQFDIYISQNRFWGGRRIASLAELDALYVDIDFYKKSIYRGTNWRYVLDDALNLLGWAKITNPSLAINSGRGLYLVWLIDSIPRQALPRWNACQKHLWNVLKPLNADRQALDAARVLRVVGTNHSQTGKKVTLITIGDYYWDFDTLADEILPIERAVLHDLRVQRALRKPQKSIQTPLTHFTPAGLWEGRLSELQRLREYRYKETGGCLPPGQRDSWLFLAANAMSWLIDPSLPLLLRREIYALSKEVGNWTEAGAKSQLHGIFTRAHASARGEKVVWNNTKIDPRFRFKDETIIEWLEITNQEMRTLDFKHLVTNDVKRERNTEQKRSARHEKGENKITRDEYQGSAQEKRGRVIELFNQGMSKSEIARIVGISRRTVQHYLL